MDLATIGDVMEILSVGFVILSEEVLAIFGKSEAFDFLVEGPAIEEGIIFETENPDFLRGLVVEG